MIATTGTIIYAPRRFIKPRRAGHYGSACRSIEGQPLVMTRFISHSWFPYAGVVELADTPDLGSGAARFGGSSPPSRILFNLRLFNSRLGNPSLGKPVYFARF